MIGRTIQIVFAIVLSVGVVLSISLRNFEIPNSRERHKIAVAIRVEFKNCAARYSLSLSSPATDLAVAYVSVEQLARALWRQDFELRLAKLAWVLGVRSPVKTLGVSQISEDTFDQFSVRDWLSRFITSDARSFPFWRLMADRCLSLLSAYHLIEEMTDAETIGLEALLNCLNGSSVLSVAAQQSRSVYRVLFREAFNNAGR